MKQQFTEKREENGQDPLVALTAQVTAAYVGNNVVPAQELPTLIRTVHKALGNVGKPEQPPVEAKPVPAVPIRRSVTPDYIVCLEDGKKLKMLKRHLRATYNMTPDEYRAKWNLPADYPMAAPNYAERRSQFAKEIGLGRRPATDEAPAAEPETPK